MEETQKELTVKEAKKEKKKKNKELTYKPNKKGEHISKFLNFMRILVIPTYWVFKPFRIYGPKEKIKGAGVYVCNHYTMFDCIYPAATTWEAMHFVAKRENFETPVLGAVIRGANGICANRDGNDVRAMLDCFKCLKNNEKISIFPEGTRNKTDADMLPFHHGAAIMAIKTKTPIVPMMIYKRPKLFRMTHILLGEPVELSEYYGRKMTETEALEADEKVRQMMLNLRKEHAEFLANKKKKGKVKKS